eukprot:1644679-Lingulodinium_polyedra.AAC.1
MPGRTEFLEVEFVRAGITLVGVEEARAREPGVRCGKRYFVFRSAGARGQLGCELLAACEYPTPRLQAWASVSQRSIS